MTKINNKYLDTNINKKPVEIVYELENKELINLEKRTQTINKSKLSPAARSKVVKKHGADYLSERVFNHDIALTQMYGPG